MKNFLKLDVTPYILAIFGIIFLIAAFYSYKQPLSYELTTSATPTVETPVTISLAITKQLAPYTPEVVNITLTHKYNTDESYEFNVESYEKGKYQFMFTPHYSGDYYVSIEVTDNGKSQVFNDTININQ